MAKQRILVVDDDHEGVRLMRAYLEQAGFEVLVAYTCESAVHSLRAERPDLLLLDLMLPDRDGYDITRFVRADPKLAQIPIIMLTARVDNTDKIVGLELGADDYITKPYNPREVVARVRARLRTHGAPGSHILRTGDLQMDLQRREVIVSGREVELTPSEYSLLRVLMERAGYVLTRNEQITHGLGTDYEGINRTLDSHMRNLRRKVEPDPSNPIYIETLYGVGYRLRDE